MIIEHLIADCFGSHVGKYSERLKITQGKQTLAQAPLMHLQTVTIASKGVSISADALAACCERGISIFFLDSHGNPYASIYAPGLTGTVLTRRAQLLAYYDWRGLHFALNLVAAKIHNQAANLKYFAKTRTESAPETAQELKLCAAEVLDCLAYLDKIEDTSVEDARQTIMAAEGQAARRYWSAIAALFPTDYGWPGRQGRGAGDPLNSLLNYGYGMLYAQVEKSLILAGLDPYAGFLHADRPGKPSLTLDLIEEFRQIAVDRLIFGLATRHFTILQDDKGRLEAETRQALAEKIIEHLEAGVRYGDKRYPLRIVLQNQARHLAAFLRGEYEAYSPFKATY